MGECGQIKIRREIRYIILVVDILFQMRTVRIRPEKNSLSLFKINVAFIRSEFLLFFHATPFVSVIDIQGESLPLVCHLVEYYFPDFRFQDNVDKILMS